MIKLGCVGISEDTILRFFTVPVSVPATAFQVKRAGGYNLFGLFMALGARDLFGAHLDKFFAYRSLTAFKFVYRHNFRPRMVNIDLILTINCRLSTLQ